MFKKYYQDANNDIKADEAFINSVIENAQKKRVPSQKSYYKYALTAAAAVVVLSATAISMPLLTDNHNDGVISVVTQTAQPKKDEVSNTPTLFPVNTVVPNPSESVKTKPQTAKKETKTDNQNTETTEKKEEKKNETASFKAMQRTDKTETANAVPESGIETDGVAMFSAALSGGIPDTAEDMAADSGTFNTETTDGVNDAAANTAENNPKRTSGGSGGGGGVVDSSMKVSGAVAEPSMQSVVLPPSGYYVSEAGNGRYVFTTDGGATITVITENTTGADTEPVYDGLNVSFISNGISFSIYSDGAEKSVIDELVNSLR